MLLLSFKTRTHAKNATFIVPINPFTFFSLFSLSVEFEAFKVNDAIKYMNIIFFSHSSRTQLILYKVSFLTIVFFIISRRIHIVYIIYLYIIYNAL